MLIYPKLFLITKENQNLTYILMLAESLNSEGEAAMQHVGDPVETFKGWTWAAGGLCSAASPFLPCMHQHENTTKNGWKLRVNKIQPSQRTDQGKSHNQLPVTRLGL